ncbi:MAG: hypothetical protein FI718_07415 [SAR202 cluster bacterium]|nr:hypothetical protein [Chloroflexota bacterium]MQG39791.1 hypothetical protein [SAR202 cluster bacterium]
MPTEINLSVNANVATIKIENPLSLNSIDYNGWANLQQTCTDLAKSKEIKAAIFTGTGNKCFSSGADIKDFINTRYNKPSAKKYAEVFDGALNAIELMPYPTISLIKGLCFGGGCELAMTTDIRIASDTSIFAIPVSKLGILIGYGEMKRLIHIVGKSTASYLLYSGKRLDSQEALRVGLINEIKSLESIDSYVSELAQNISKTAPLSHSRHKQIMKIVLDNPSLSNLSEEEKSLPFENFETSDYQEGMSAFTQHRTPKFNGS